MERARLVKSKFWSDNYIIDLDPVEKLLYLYLITNDKTNICGIYELSLKKMSFETGIDTEVVKKILARFENDGKVLFSDGWVAIKAFIKNQNLHSPKVQTGIENELKNAPEKHRVYIQYGYCIVSKSKSKSKSKSESKSESKEKHINSLFDFSTIWNAYPNKIGHKLALKHFNASVQTEQDYADIQKALANYKQSKPVLNGFVQNGSTWFNNWKDWVHYEEPKKLTDGQIYALKKQREAEDAKRKAI